MGRKSKDNHADYARARWLRLVQRLMRSEVRASTIALIILVTWLILLIRMWQNGGHIFGIG